MFTLIKTGAMLQYLPLSRPYFLSLKCNRESPAQFENRIKHRVYRKGPYTLSFFRVQVYCTRKTDEEKVTMMRCIHIARSQTFYGKITQ